MAKNNAPATPAADTTAPASDTATAADQLPPTTDETSAPPAADNPATDTPAAEGELRKVLLLVDNAFGRCAQVVKVLVHEAEALLKSGEADDHPAAIAAHED